MRRAQGYARIFSPDGVKEIDTALCNHCQRVVHVKPMQDPASIEYGGTCKGCMKFICAPCVGELTTLGKCIPFEKRLEAYERGESFAKAVGLVLRSLVITLAFWSTVEANDLRVTWTNPIDGDPATEIRVERSLMCSGRYPWEQVAVLAPSATSYYDAGLNDGEEYCYRIRHCNAVGCGGYTSIVGNRVRRLPTGGGFQMS